MVKNYSKKKLSANKKSFTLLQGITILSLLLINIYLLYNIVLTVIPSVSEVKKTTRVDSLNTKIQVEVLNGCGVSGIADRLTDYLRQLSFDVVNIGNYRSFDVEKSIIIDRTGKIQNASLIAESLGLNDSNIIQQINKEYLLDITIILGKDYLDIIPLKKRS